MQLLKKVLQVNGFKNYKQTFQHKPMAQKFRFFQKATAKFHNRACLVDNQL